MKMGMIIRGQLMLLGQGNVGTPVVAEVWDSVFTTAGNAMGGMLGFQLNAEQLMEAMDTDDETDQDETDDLDQERDLLASLIQKLKCESDDRKNR
ncbi:hypothetical protein Tco_0608857 [Tanacetum coccineum]